MSKLAKLLVSFFVLFSLFSHSVRAQEVCSMDAPSARLSTGKALAKLASLLKKSGISKVPSTTSALKTNSSSSSLALSDDISIKTVSGTAPTLISIPGIGAKNIFWRQGVVDAIATGQPTDLQCNEFFGSDVEGQSGGFGACNMAEAVGHSFQNLVESEISLCYMKNVVKKQNFTSGGVTVISGKVPADTTTLFAPGVKQKIIKANKPKLREDEFEESVFIKIPSLSQNESRGLLYKAEMYFCLPGQTKARGSNTIQIKKNGQMKITLSDDSSVGAENKGSNYLIVDGYLTPSSSKIGWDPTRSRHSVINSIRSDNTFKSEFYVTADNLIVLKDRFESLGQLSNLRKTYSISSFSGTDASNVIFREGGYKGDNNFDNQSNEFYGAAEFRDIIYASAPKNALFEQAASYDLTTDSFYTSAPEVNFDGDAFACGAKPTIELQLNKDNTTLQESLKTCVSQEQNFRSMEFCRTDPSISQAQQNFRTACADKRRPPPRR